MANPYFTKDASTLTFTQGLQLPTSNPTYKVQAQDRTAAGTVEVEDFGLSYQQLRLFFEFISAAKYAELETWFDTIADGASNTFTFTDEDSTAYTVRIITNPLAFENIRPGYYSGELVLEVV